jgi:hypothetical protein
MQTAALTTYKRTAYKKINDKLQRLWKQYNKGDTNNDQLIWACAKMFAPVDV